MDARKIKLALTVGLMNGEEEKNDLHLIRNLMIGLREDVGNFLGLSKVENSALDGSHVKETYAMQYEKCTLDVDFISNRQTNKQYIQSFQLR